uniref:uncharacterized protein LOC114581987 n=1 Tax=Podarcis muralis TaxID=64176 RepID=UPI0010A066D0|nr:uncharacterized protein LOC114581987 [Podarcis muralis]
MARLRSGGRERHSGSERPRAGAPARTELRQPPAGEPDGGGGCTKAAAGGGDLWRRRRRRSSSSKGGRVPGPKAPPLRRLLLRGRLAERAPAALPAPGWPPAPPGLTWAEEEGSAQRARCLAPPRKAGQALRRVGGALSGPRRGRRRAESASLAPKKPADLGHLLPSVGVVEQSQTQMEDLLAGPGMLRCMCEQRRFALPWKENSKWLKC